METPNLYLLDHDNFMRYVAKQPLSSSYENVLVDRLAETHRRLEEVKTILEKFDIYIESGLEESIRELVDENIDLINKNNELEQSLKEAESRISMLENNLLDFAATTSN